jgi:hypothetical protein
MVALGRCRLPKLSVWGKFGDVYPRVNRRASEMKKMKERFGNYAKEREEFEQKKKQLEEEMTRGKKNMEKIRRGISIRFTPSGNENDEEISIKRTKSWRTNRPDTTEQFRSPPVPSGPKISDWCYATTNNSVGGDPSPPILKSQELYEEVRFLGRGSYGTVDLVKNREENKLSALPMPLVSHSLSLVLSQICSQDFSCEAPTRGRGTIK